METDKVHPSHQMEDVDYADDRHCMMSCKVCGMSHCCLCPEGSGIDDDALKAECIGFPWYRVIWNGDRLIGRKSGTGWPKGKS